MRSLIWFIILTSIVVPLVGQNFSTSLSEGQPISIWHSDIGSNGPEALSKALNYSGEDSLAAISQHRRMGSAHTRYQRYHKGLKVLGEQVILHEKRDEQFVNGHSFGTINLPNKKDLLPNSEIRSLLIEHLNSNYPGQFSRSSLSKYEKVICNTLYPRPGGKMTVAALFQTKVAKSHSNHRILLDMYSGQVIIDIDLSLTCAEHRSTSAMGGNVVNTLYHGPQDILLGKVHPDTFALVYDHNDTYIQIFKHDSTHFWDLDGQVMQDDSVVTYGVVDGFWATIQTTTFFEETFGHKGLRNKGPDTITSFMFPLEAPLATAFWDGKSIHYGTGDKDLQGPFTSIDICAHEIMHGITQFSSALEYAYEPGALNEAFSDIFGKVVEYHKSPQDFSWGVGARITLDTTLPLSKRGFRNLADPWIHFHPKYYRGRFWRDDSFDNGRVHTNSNVLNHWFYLITEGGSGINENGIPYQVEALGIDKAMQIAYQTLVFYLTPLSQYSDARKALLEVTKQLFGNCSFEAIQVQQAFQAVGLGSAILEGDLSVDSDDRHPVICMDSVFYPSLTLSNNGCQNVLRAGESIKVFYQYMNQSYHEDSVVLSNDLLPGESIEHTFSTPISNIEEGDFTLTLGIHYQSDTTHRNDTLRTIVESHLNYDFDLMLIPIFDNRPPCERDTFASLFFAGSYLGCTPISSTDSFFLRMELNEQLVEKYIRPTATIYPGGFAQFEQIPLEVLKYGQNRAEVSITHARDPIDHNNTKTVDFYVIETIDGEYEEHFDSHKSIDSSFISIAQGQFVQNNIEKHMGESWLVMTGSSIHHPDSSLRLVNVRDHRLMLLTDFGFLTTIDLCYEGSHFIDPMLEFRVKHLPSDNEYWKYGIPDGGGTVSAVDINGYLKELQYLNDTTARIYQDTLPDGDTTYNIRFRFLTLMGQIDSTDRITAESDRILLDYIKITGEVITSTPASETQPFLLKPNPSSSDITLFREGEEMIPSGKLYIFNSTGDLVWSRTLEKSSSLTISPDLASGVYSVLLRAHSGESYIAKLVRQ